MAEETGVREAFDNALRVALTVATQLGERVARLREQFGRHREARAVQTNRELEARFEAERGAMRASLLPLQQRGWWDGASVTDIANARETATAWRDFDDVARETNDTIAREVHERYGVQVSQPGAYPAEVAEALRPAESERAEAATKREQDGKELTAADGGAAKTETPEAARAAESLRIATAGLAPQTPGSPVPSTLHPSKPKTPVTPRERDGHGRE